MSTASLPAAERYLTRAEAAEILKLKSQTLARWAMDARNLPFVKRGRIIRYRYSDILRFLENNVVGGAIN